MKRYAPNWCEREGVAMREYRDVLQQLDESGEDVFNHIAAGFDGLLLYVSSLVEEAVYRGVRRALAEEDR